METLTIEITPDIKGYVERKLASGRFKDPSAVVQMLFDVAMRAETRQKIDQMLIEGIDQIDRGECAPWRPAEDRTMLQEMIHERKLNGKT